MLSAVQLYKKCINITYKNQATAKHVVHDSFENITNYQLVEMNAIHACYATLLEKLACNFLSFFPFLLLRVLRSRPWQLVLAGPVLVRS